MAGYSGKLLHQKLGIKAEQRAAFVHAPPGYLSTLSLVPKNTDQMIVTSADAYDFIQCFATESLTLEKELPALIKRLSRSGALWISWPKRSSKMQSDVNENDVRRIGLRNGLVDVKICAVDVDWSALKFVYRLADR